MNPNFYKGMPALNPKGRPKGIVNKYTLLAREMMTEKGPDVVDKVIEMALDGDVHCLKMCIDRILPVHKAVDPNRTKSDSNIVINVGTSAEIQAKISETPIEKLVNPIEKDDDVVIAEIEEEVK
jgi:hypothetical protein